MKSPKPVLIREYVRGEELQLREVFHSSVHELARDHYAPEQLEAWAPAEFKAAAWVDKIRAIRPFVAVTAKGIAGYASVGRVDGLIDHFYVAGAFAHQGYGTSLMKYILDKARHHNLAQVAANVSLCAEGFFTRHGFYVLDRHTVRVGSVVLPRVRMTRSP